jgi:NitT/TauT family transport system ATP-binding protein
MQTRLEAPATEPRTIKAEVPAVEAVGLGHRFGELEVIRRFDMAVAADEVVGVVGPSGSGKSTLLELVAGLSSPSEGALRVYGEGDAAGRLARCAYMPQRDLLLPWLSALDNAALAPRNRGASREQARAAAAPLFDRFGLAGFERSAPAELSGGMRQRVAFLRTLLAGKPVLLLDEPFASLDAITRSEMQEWLATALAAESRTVLLVSHDVEEALYLCDRVVVLSRRPATVVTELGSPLRRAVPREHAVADPAFVVQRERALRHLREGSR